MRRAREVDAPVAPPKPLRVRRRGTLPPLPPMKMQARK